MSQYRRPRSDRGWNEPEPRGREGRSVERRDQYRAERRPGPEARSNRDYTSEYDRDERTGASWATWGPMRPGRQGDYYRGDYGWNYGHGPDDSEGEADYRQAYERGDYLRTSDPEYSGDWGDYGRSTRRGDDFGDEEGAYGYEQRGYGNYGSYGRTGTDTDRFYERGAIPRGPYTGRGPQGYQRSDERIHEDVCAVLTQHGDIDASTMQVQVENGEVTLSGSVRDRRTKRLAEDVLEALSGVRQVHNRLRLEQPTDAQPNRSQTPK